jgi:hypothetical protein
MTAETRTKIALLASNFHSKHGIDILDDLMFVALITEAEFISETSNKILNLIKDMNETAAKNLSEICPIIPPDFSSKASNKS